MPMEKIHNCISKCVHFLKNQKNRLIRKEIVRRNIKYYVGPFKIWSCSLLKKMFKEHYEIIKNHDFICLLNSNLGEAFLFFKFFLPGIEQANLKAKKRTLILTTNSAHIELAQALGITNIFCISDFSADNYDTFFKYRGKEFLVVFNYEHYVTTESEIRSLNAHFFKKMEQTLNTKPATFEFRRVKIKEEIKQSTYRKATEIGLQLDNFVMIIPHANSCYDLDKSLMHELVGRAISNGLHVFINTWEPYKGNDPMIHVSYDFTLQELFVLAQHAREIYAIRCGLIEFLSDTQTPMTVISERFKNRAPWEPVTEENVLSGFNFHSISPEYSFIKEITQSEFKDEITNK